MTAAAKRVAPRSAARRLFPLWALCALSLVGCTTRGPVNSLPADGDRPRVATFRARSVDATGRGQRFKLRVVAQRPDRVYAEVVGPVGGTVLTVQGDAADLTVIFPKQRSAYRGPADPTTLEALFGVRMRLDSWVGALFGEVEQLPGVRLEREGSVGQYPGSLTLQGAGGRLELKLRRTAPLPAGTDPWRNATIPGHFTSYNLDELPPLVLPEDSAS